MTVIIHKCFGLVNRITIKWPPYHWNGFSNVQSTIPVFRFIYYWLIIIAIIIIITNGPLLSYILMCVSVCVVLIQFQLNLNDRFRKSVDNKAKADIIRKIVNEKQFTSFIRNIYFHAYWYRILLSLLLPSAFRFVCFAHFYHHLSHIRLLYVWNGCYRL